MNLRKIQKLYAELSTVEVDNIFLDIEFDRRSVQRNNRRITDINREINNLMEPREFPASDNLIVVDFINKIRL